MIKWKGGGEIAGHVAHGEVDKCIHNFGRVT